MPAYTRKDIQREYQKEVADRQKRPIFVDDARTKFQGALQKLGTIAPNQTAALDEARANLEENNEKARSQAYTTEGKLHQLDQHRKNFESILTSTKTEVEMITDQATKARHLAQLQASEKEMQVVFKEEKDRLTTEQSELHALWDNKRKKIESGIIRGLHNQTTEKKTILKSNSNISADKDEPLELDDGDEFKSDSGTKIVSRDKKLCWESNYYSDRQREHDLNTACAILNATNPNKKDVTISSNYKDWNGKPYDDKEMLRAMWIRMNLEGKNVRINTIGDPPWEPSADDRETLNTLKIEKSCDPIENEALRELLIDSKAKTTPFKPEEVELLSQLDFTKAAFNKEGGEATEEEKIKTIKDIFKKENLSITTVIRTSLQRATR
jgi:hypothetical protein